MAAETPESSENRETVGSGTAESVAASASELQNESKVTSMRGWLLKRRDFDRLRQLRPWGVGNVVQHSVKVGEGRFDGGQLRIERDWPDG